MNFSLEKLAHDIEVMTDCKLAAISNPMGGSSKNTGAPKVKSNKTVANTAAKPIMSAAPINKMMPAQGLAQAAFPGAPQNTATLQMTNVTPTLSENNSIYLPQISQAITRS